MKSAPILDVSIAKGACLRPINTGLEVRNQMILVLNFFPVFILNLLLIGLHF